MVKSHDEATSLRWAGSTDRNVTGDVNLINRPSGAPCEGPLNKAVSNMREEREEMLLTSLVNVCTVWLSIATATRSRFLRVYGAMADTVSVETVNSELSSSSMPEKILTSQS